MQGFIGEFSPCNDILKDQTIAQTRNDGFCKNVSKLGKIQSAEFLKQSKIQGKNSQILTIS